VAISIKTDDSDKVKGDKRLTATVFIMSSIIILGVSWARQNCSEGIRANIYNTTGYYYPDYKKARAAGVKV
jgi:spermidine/putrescine-binding protein